MLGNCCFGNILVLLTCNWQHIIVGSKTAHPQKIQSKTVTLRYEHETETPVIMGPLRL
jgi:hypothetical protein